jgi:looped-hinge helix DNA binding domain, AbrB family
MAVVKLSKKGWVVIPKEIRERYDLHPGDEINIIDYAGNIAIIPALKDPIHEVRGMLKGGPSLTKALLEERRKEREREEEDIRRWRGTEQHGR